MSTFPERPFAYAEIRSLGISAARLARAVEEQQVRRVVRGVYVLASVPDDPAHRLRAARLALRPGQVACDRTAAWMHGVDIFGPAEHEVIPAIETCGLPREPRSRLSGVRGLNRDLLDTDIVDLGGVLVTTPLRTAADLGCNLRKRDALATLDQFQRLHGVTRGQLEGLLQRFRGRRGVVQLRVLVPLADPRAESVRESWKRLALFEAGLPAPVPQHWIDVDGRSTYRLDLAYPANRVAVEYDGIEFHSATHDRQRDERRRSWLRQNGWTVVIVRNGDFTGVRLDRWLGEVRRALADKPSNLRW